MSNVDINVDRRTDGLTDGRTENRTPISHPATSRCDKKEKLAISPLFHNIFSISLTSRVQLHIYLLNVVNRISFFLSSANLICQSTDISKYCRESFGIRHNQSTVKLFFQTK